MRLIATFATVFAASALVLVVSCGSDGSTFTNGGSSGASSSGMSSSGFGSSGNSSSGASGTSAGDGGAEVCDGIDNDGNGVIDDVDVGHDGICDCLRIATLGIKGTWGVGDVFNAWLNGKSTNGATDLGSQTLTPALLAPFQVIVAQDVKDIGRTYASSEVKALSDWVKAGGGLMTLIGYGDATERTNANTLLAEFGMSYKATPILAKQGGSTVPITGWVAHPVTNGISKVGVDNGYEVDGTGTTLATEQGFTLLKVQEVGKGHVAVWGDEWITYDSEWKDHPDYQVERFWLNTIKWLTPANNCQVPIPSSVK